MREKFGPSF